MTEGLQGRDLDGFVAAAHELKAPLTLISHLASVLDDETVGLDVAEQREAVERIRLSAERTLRLVQGLTVSHRLDAQGQLAFGFTLEPLSIGRVCQEVVHEMLPLAQACRQTIEVRVPQKGQLVVGNRELLRGVFFNLIDNAIRHNAADAVVRLRLRRRAGQVRLCVQDSGPGLSRQTWQRLHQTLGYELQPLSGRSASSGLGLYIAGQMAVAMGGRLGMGRPRQGADFHVDLQYSKQLSFRL